MNEEYVWKDVGVVGFDELMQALERADRKGYMPDAVKEAWEGFNWKPAQQQEPPTVAELVCVCGAEWEWRNRDWELVATPPAQRTWVNATTWRGLTVDEILYCVELENPKAIVEEVEAKLKAKNSL